MERPYMRFRADDLLIIANNSQNLNEVQAIVREFQFRTTKRSRQVCQHILESRFSEASFRWPTTEAPGGSNTLAKRTVFKHPRGMLKYLGYQVGINGRTLELRKQILDRVYKRSLPFINSAAYMAEWGQPASSSRLQKLAESIAAFTRNAKRNDPELHGFAISDWENDLRYLKRNYYDGRYDFAWPQTAL